MPFVWCVRGWDNNSHEGRYQVTILTSWYPIDTRLPRSLCTFLTAANFPATRAVQVTVGLWKMTHECLPITRAYNAWTLTQNPLQSPFYIQASQSHKLTMTPTSFRPCLIPHCLDIKDSSIRHRSDAKVSDRCLIDIESRVFGIWVTVLQPPC